MSVEKLLSLLDGVKKTGPNKWMAKCPAHSDKTPSLAVTESAGTVLVHCFGGCSIHEVVSAVGIDIEDMFPPREHHQKPNNRPFQASDILRLLANEAMIVAASAATMRKRALTETEVERVIESAAKINAALNAGGITTWHK